MRMRSAYFAAFVIASATAFGQAVEPEDEAAKGVSNDDPGRPLQMPPASTEAREAIGDFERFARRGAWERALKAIDSIPEDQADRFVDGDDGFIVPVQVRRRALLAELPPEGRAAGRLFHDAEARKLLDEAQGAEELSTLERIVSAYFLTSVGDDAADRLGDAYFELGRFDRAADCWLAVLRDRPDSDLAPALLSVKAALALAIAGRDAEYEEIAADLAGRYAGEEVTLGGRTAPASELLGELVGEQRAEPTTASGSGDVPEIPESPEVAWQVRIADSVEAGMTPAELEQWRGSPLSAAVPAAAVDGGTLFVDYLGNAFAVDLETGKLRWRSGSFHNLDLAAAQNRSQWVDPGRYAVLAAGGRAWFLERDLKDQNYNAAFSLTCRRADGGDIVWRSTDLNDFEGLDLVGRPVLVDGKLLIAAKDQTQRGRGGGTPELRVLAIRPLDGEVLWRTGLGTDRESNPYYSYYSSVESDPQPRFLCRSGSVYVETHLGVLARLDLDSGVLDWGFGYETEPAQSDGGRFFFGDSPSVDPASDGGAPLFEGGALLVKGAKSDRLHAIDPDRMAVLWERPLAKSSQLLESGDGAVYLGGPELGAIGLDDRALRWATRLPGGSGSGRLLAGPDGIWQLTPRGIFEVDPGDGAVRRIVRGADLGSAGGDLLLTERWLLAVSNRAISAYPLRAIAAGPVGSTTDVEAASDE